MIYLQFTINELRKIKYYNLNLLMNYFLVIINITIQLSVLFLFLDETEQINKTIIYVMMSNFILTFLGTNRVLLFAEKIKKGEIIQYFVFPTSIFYRIIFEEIGVSIRILINFALILVFVIIFKNTVLDYNFFIILFFISLIFSIVLSILLSTFVYSYVFIIIDYAPIKPIISGFTLLLSGAIIPLYFFPESILKIVEYLPFNCLVDIPINVLIYGEYKKIFVQVLWIVFFYIFAKKNIDKFLFRVSFMEVKVIDKLSVYYRLVKNDFLSQKNDIQAFRVNIVIWFIYSCIPLFTITILLEKFKNLGGYSVFEIALFYSVLGFSYDFARMIGRGFDNFQKLIINRDIEIYLTRPYSVLFQVIANNFF